MNHTTLEKIISDTQSSPYIKWNDESLADLIRIDNVYNVFIFNKDGNHGYFSSQKFFQFYQHQVN